MKRIIVVLFITLLGTNINLISKQTKEKISYNQKQVITASYITPNSLQELEEISPIIVKGKFTGEREHDKDPNVIGPLLWLRQREIVHYARFKELFEYYDKKIKNGNNYINEPQKTNMNYNYNNDYLLYKLHTDNNSFF